MTNFDFGALNTVERANPVKNRKQDWKLKRSTRKGREDQVFIFSQALFDELGLENHSVKIRHNGTETSEPTVALLALYPGNDGNWVKASQKGKKGKVHKNVELCEILDKIGITDERLDVEFVGEDPSTDIPHYKIVPFDSESTTASDNVAAPATEIAADVAESVEEEVAEVAEDDGQYESASPEPVQDEDDNF